MNDGIFIRVRMSPLMYPASTPARMHTGYARYPIGFIRRMKATEMNETSPPTERSIPPTRIVHIWPRATIRRIAEKLMMVLRL